MDFPSAEKVTSVDFDITLMMHLLNTLAHIKDGNYYPVSTGTSVSAMISRIKFIRNDTTQKLEGKFSDDQFNQYWDDIVQVI